MVAAASDRPTPDDLEAAAARRLPGYGGFFVGADGTAYVYFRQGSAFPGVTALASVLGGQRADFLGRHIRSLRVLQGQYGFDELAGFRDRLIASPDVHDLRLVDIDETVNRLRIGIRPGASIGAWVEKLGSLGVPREAVIVEHREAPVAAATLGDVVRPTLGGSHLQFIPPGNPFGGTSCTLGFNARNNQNSAIAYFVTNSHCSGTMGQVNSDVFHQPYGAAGNPIGVETVDPPFNLVDPACPPGYLCRRSDALLGTYNSGIQVSLNLARTTGYGSIVLASNPFVVSGYLRDVDLFVGRSLDHIGNSSGWQPGTVTNTCVHGGNGPPGKWFVCEYGVASPNLSGDSGGPVFAVAPDGTVWLAGILRAGNGLDFYTFSTFESIRSELGLFRITDPPAFPVVANLDFNPWTVVATVGYATSATARLFDQFGSPYITPVHVAVSNPDPSALSAPTTVTSAGGVASIAFSPLRAGSFVLGAYYPGIAQTQWAQVISYSPLPVSIAGKSSVRPNSTCTWQASSSGGTPPYTYTWTATFGGQPSGDSFTGTVHASGSELLTVSVVDAIGRRGGASKPISISAGAQVCQQ